MKKHLVQHYGPLLDEIEEIGEFLRFSEQAFIIGAEEGGTLEEDWGTVEGRVLQILMLYALNTSYSIRLLTTYRQTLEAFALLRIRLEQGILFSFLIHSKPEDGFIPYVQDIGRVDYRAYQSLDKDPELRDLLAELTPWKIDAAKILASLNEKMIDPDFDLEKDKLKRKWTKLSLYDMAVCRDQKLPECEAPMSTELTKLYLGLYKPSSIIVHCDTGCLTDNFLTLNSLPGGGKQLGPQLVYFFLNLIHVANLDLLQNYEMLYFLNKPGKKRIAELYKRFTNVFEGTLGIKEDK